MEYFNDWKNDLHDAIVVEIKAFDSREVGKIVNFSDLIVGEIDGVELI